jgi:DNA-binding MarR family transcriptional regulator
MPVDVSKFSRYSVPSDSLGFLLRQMFMVWRRSVESGLSEIDLTHIQFVFLIGLGWLTRQGKRARQQDLGEFCKCSRALTSQTVATLIRKGLVLRVSDTADRRSKLLTLSAAGERKVREAVPILEGVEKSFLGSNRALRTRLDRDLRAALAIVRPADAEGGVPLDADSDSEDAA